MKIIGQNFFSLISSGQLPANGEAIDRTGSVNYGARELGKEFDFFTALDNSPLDTNPEIGKVSAYVRPSKTNPRLERQVEVQFSGTRDCGQLSAVETYDHGLTCHYQFQSADGVSQMAQVDYSTANPTDAESMFEKYDINQQKGLHLLWSESPDTMVSGGAILLP